jgi:hypothetical protein
VAFEEAWVTCSRTHAVAHATPDFFWGGLRATPDPPLGVARRPLLALGSLRATLEVAQGHPNGLGVVVGHPSQGVRGC